MKEKWNILCSCRSGKSDDRVICIPRVDDIFASIMAVVLMQLLTYHSSNIMVLDVDKPRDLSRSI